MWSEVSPFGMSTKQFILFFAMDAYMAATFFAWFTFTCHVHWHIEAYSPCRYGTWSHMEKLPLGPLFLSLSNMHSSWARVSDKAKEVNHWNPLNMCTFSQVPHDLICAKQPHHATSSGAKWPWWLKQTSFSWRCFSTLVALEWNMHFVIFEVMSTEVGTGATNASCMHLASFCIMVWSPQTWRQKWHFGANNPWELRNSIWPSQTSLKRMKMVQVQRRQVKGARDPLTADWRFNLSGLKNIGKIRLNESDADLQLAKELLRFYVQCFK